MPCPTFAPHLLTCVTRLDTSTDIACFAGFPQRRGHQGGLQVSGDVSCRAAHALSSAAVLQAASTSSSVSPLSLAEVADELLDRRQRRELLLPEPRHAAGSMQQHVEHRAGSDHALSGQQVLAGASGFMGGGCGVSSSLDGKQACNHLAWPLELLPYHSIFWERVACVMLGFIALHCQSAALIVVSMTLRRFNCATL